MLDHDGLVDGVGAFADCTHAIQGGDAQSGGEVAVGCATGSCFVQLKTEFGGKRVGLAVELDGAAGALHGRAVDGAGDGERAAVVLGFKRGELLLDAGAVGFAGDADIDFGPGFGGDDVGFAAAAGEADTDGEAALEVGPIAHSFDHTGKFADGAGAFGEVDAGVGGDSFDVNAPIAGAFAGGFVGEFLGWFEDVDGRALRGEALGDGARDGTADFFIGVEKQNELAVEQGGFGEELDGGEGHGDAGLHVERTGAPKAAVGDAEGHGFEGAEGPDRIQMTEEEDWLGGVGLGAGAEPGFEDDAEGFLPMQFDSAAQGFGVSGGEGHAGVDGGFVVGGGLNFDQAAEQVDEVRLAAAGSSQ